jgi:type II secretory pathway predicted ATPase ExeA
MTDSNKLTAPPSEGNAPVPGGIWPIRSAATMAEAVDTCRLSGQIGLVTGPSGIGKTTAARAVVNALEEAGETAHYVMMTRAADRLQPGLHRIGRAIGAAVDANMGEAGMYDAVAHAVAGWPRGAVLVLDEAQFMTEALLDGLRNISDEMRGRGLRRGIVMVGTPDLAARINGKIGGRAKHHEPLRGRLYLAELGPLSADDFAGLARALGLAGAGAAEAIAKAGAGRGGLHNVARVMEAAREVAGPGKAPAVAHIRVAMQGLGVAS